MTRSNRIQNAGVVHETLHVEHASESAVGQSDFAIGTDGYAKASASANGHDVYVRAKLIRIARRFDCDLTPDAMLSRAAELLDQGHYGRAERLLHHGYNIILAEKNLASAAEIAADFDRVHAFVVDLIRYRSEASRLQRELNRPQDAIVSDFPRYADAEPAPVSSAAILLERQALQDAMQARYEELPESARIQTALPTDADLTLLPVSDLAVTGFAKALADLEREIGEALLQDLQALEEI